MDELKSIQLINGLLQKEINVKHKVKHISINTEINMNNMNGVNYDDERAYRTNNTGWMQVVNGPKRKTSKRQNYYRRSKQIAITNRSASLRSLQESDVSHQENDSDTSKISEEKVSKEVTMTQSKRKIIITGDSQARGHAKRLREQLGNSFSITGFVKPKADSDNITNSAKAEKENMMENDAVTLCGGMKNIGKNEASKGLRCISQFLEHQLHIKVLIMKAPHRHNLIPTSCVNKEVANFNRKLQKITKKI